MEYAKQQREAFMNTMEHRLKQLEAKASELKHRVAADKASIEADAQGDLAALDRALDSARSKMAEARKDTGKAWDDVKTGVSRALDDLQQAWDRAAEQFNQPDE